MFKLLDSTQQYVYFVQDRAAKAACLQAAVHCLNDIEGYVQLKKERARDRMRKECEDSRYSTGMISDLERFQVDYHCIMVVIRVVLLLVFLMMECVHELYEVHRVGMNPSIWGFSLNMRAAGTPSSTSCYDAHCPKPGGIRYTSPKQRGHGEDG